MIQLRLIGAALSTQAVLHGQLARVEWEQEKNRLSKLLLVASLGIACLLCALLFIGILVLVSCWETPYCIPAVMAIIALYSLGVGIGWYRYQLLLAQGSEAFAASREELAADIALIKKNL